MADREYTARLVTNPGRPGMLVEFRHPGILDRAGYGRKVKRGLGTSEKTEAEEILKDLNAILADKTLHEIGARKIARGRFRAKAVEVFYGAYARDDDVGTRRREKALALPDSQSASICVALVGNTGVGKTTLLRHCLGIDPVRERFLATSGNRTTLFPTEIIVEDGPYRAVVSFLRETETEQSLGQMALKAVMRAFEGRGDEAIVRELFEPSEEGLRLKYLLGVPKADGNARVDELARKWTKAVHAITQKARAEALGILQEPSDKLSHEDQLALRDLMEDVAEESTGMEDLVSDMLEELRECSQSEGVGTIVRSPTKWPVVWTLDVKAEERQQFIREVKRFIGNAREEFGRLLTPLASGVRVSGPFFPRLIERRLPIVFCDTVGLGHYADTAADLPEDYIALCERADCILLTESAKNAFSSAALHRALEATATAGQVGKLAVAFTHMDGLAGDDVSDDGERQEKALLGLRDALDEHVAKKLSREAARQLANRLQDNVYFFGSLQDRDPHELEPELRRLFDHFAQAKPKAPRSAVVPEYDFDFFALHVSSAVEGFRTHWAALLGVRPRGDIPRLHWQAPKAIARRYAQDWFDSYPHRPVSNLRAHLSREIAKFLDAPLSWPSGAPSDEEKRAVIDLIKSELSQPLRQLSARIVRLAPRAQWLHAWEFRGRDSTIERRNAIEALLAQHVPYQVSGDAEARTFMKSIRAEVEMAIERAKGKLLLANP